MKRRFAFTLGALALGWLAGPATAVEPITPPAKVVVVQAAPAKPAEVKVEAAPMPKDAVIIKDGHHHPMPAGHHDGCVKPDCGGSDTRILAGIGFAYVLPHWETNPAYFVVSADATLGGGGAILLTTAAGVRSVEFDWDYEWSPRLWVGAIDCDGFGGRISWQHFDHGVSQNAALTAENLGFTPAGNVIGSNASAIFIADPLGVNAGLLFTNVNAPGILLGGGGLINPFAGTDQLAFESDLKINVWDFDVIQEITNDKWSLLLAGGIRYAHLSQSYRAFRSNSDSFDLGAAGLTIILEDFAVVKSGHNFDGLGPTVAAEIRRTVGDNLALYGKTRAALLYGEGKHIANGASTFIIRTDPAIPGAGPNGEIARLDSFTSAEVGRDDLLPVAEIELGAQFGADVGDNRVMLGLGVVSQTWFGAGNASSENGNMGLFGIIFSAGLSY